MDGDMWEFHFLYENPQSGPGTDHHKRRFMRVAAINQTQLQKISQQDDSEESDVDARIVELAKFIIASTFPFPPLDKFEYWLLDPSDGTPLVMIFSCMEEEQKASYPARIGWTALPASAMPVAKTEEEKENGVPPVNSRLESLVTERVGYDPKGKWFNRLEEDPKRFPPLLIKEEWPDEEQTELCQRYIQRQAARLLMLHDLETEDRRRLEIAAKEHIFELERFYPFYPGVVDEHLMNSALVEARLRRGNQN